jgi:hypothetical protein
MSSLQEEPGPQPAPDAFRLQYRDRKTGEWCWTATLAPKPYDVAEIASPHYRWVPLFAAPLPSPEGRERELLAKIDAMMSAHPGPGYTTHFECWVDGRHDSIVRALTPTESHEEVRP